MLSVFFLLLSNMLTVVMIIFLLFLIHFKFVSVHRYIYIVLTHDDQRIIIKYFISIFVLLHIKIENFLA